MNRSYSFTGPTRIPAAWMDKATGWQLLTDTADNAVADKHDGHEFTTGAAPGFDALVMRAAMVAWPEALHRVLVPAAAHDEEAVQWAYEHGAVIEHTPAGREPYRIRNQRLVECGDALVAVVLGPAKSYPHAGEWMTIRMAYERDIPIELITLTHWRKEQH